MKKLIAFFTGLMLSVSAFATPYSEVGDAGDSIGTAQAVDAGTTSISGLGGGDAKDIYSFIWDGGALTIDTFATTFDTELFLFDDSGFGILANDDASTACGNTVGGLQSCLDFSAGLAAGTYYLAIGAFQSAAFDAGSVDIFDNCLFSEQCAADPAAGALAGWEASDAGSDSDYLIQFSAATGGGAMPAPEPTTLGLLGLGILAVGLARRKRV